MCHEIDRLKSKLTKAEEHTVILEGWLTEREHKLVAVRRSLEEVRNALIEPVPPEDDLQAAQYRLKNIKKSVEQDR